MTLEALLAWWNVIYLLPFGLALLYLFAYSASGWTFGGADHDAEAHGDVGDAHGDVDHDLSHDAAIGHDVDHDLAHDVDHDLSHEAGHDLAHEHGLHTPPKDIDADSDPSAAKHSLHALTWLGVGRVPLSILLMVLLMSFGAIGFVTNQFFAGWIDSWPVALISLPIAFVGSLAITAGVAQSLGRWLPMSETSARHRRELVGLRATAVFGTDERQGVAMVRDPGGDRYQVACRTLPGREPIAGGTEVVLVKYAEELGVFFVVPSQMPDEPSPAAGLAERDRA